ncbi:MAG: bifunctional folylpolyglutamate synthase/dihydrofolate synthase, partial [Pseudomonadota bacterium]
AGCDPAALAAIARSNGLRAEAANTFDDAIALAVSGAEDRVLICGSLYLAGYVLRRNNELPI